MFLKIDGINGEADHILHKNEIEIISWIFGIKSYTSSQPNQKDSNTKVKIQDLVITKWIDTSSPFLMKASCNQQKIPSMTLNIKRTNKDNPSEYIKYCFKDVFVSSIATGGTEGEDRLTENLSFSFTEFHFEYQPKESNLISFGWDISNCKEIK